MHQATGLFSTDTRIGTATRQAAKPVRPELPRLALLLVIAVAALTPFLVVGANATSQAVSNAGADLTRLLRAMALLKTLMAAGAAAAVLWRIGFRVTPAWFAAYATAVGAMAAGPGLIWSMAYVGTGALLLHGGLLTSILLLWRDPAVGHRLASIIAARRGAIALRAQAARASDR